MSTAWRHKFVIDQERFLFDGSAYPYTDVAKTKIMSSRTTINFAEAPGLDDCEIRIYLRNGTVLENGMKRSRHIAAALTPMGIGGLGEAAQELEEAFYRFCDKTQKIRLQKYQDNLEWTGRLLLDEEDSIIEFCLKLREVFVNGNLFGNTADELKVSTGGQDVTFSKKKSLFSSEHAVVDLRVDHDIKQHFIANVIGWDLSKW